MKRILSAVMVLVLALVLLLPEAMADSGTYYVYTENGKNLNVRYKKSTAEGTLVGTLKVGTKVEVIKTEGNWACISYKWETQSYYGEFMSGTSAWVMKKFLTKTKPGSSSSSGSSSTSKAAATTGAIGVMNREFKSLQLVDPFTVVSKPVRSTGFVNLRWAPHEEAEICGIAYAGHELVVIASTTNWYQVEDEETGKICFIMKKYTNVQ